mmetsp:Transcript_7937/g.11488  ORF Transcript_7937/g.11488 Transcript_7937/m.11488 type:complete len:337 (+) Transcript_7937:218-1228(+)
MISCVAASQLLIYRLTDGSYEYDTDYSERVSQTNDPLPKNGKQNISKRQLQRQKSALGRLVTNYRAEFTLARASFDLGLLSLLFSVAVRAIAVFDQDIALPITIIIGSTALFLAILNITSFASVFKPLENAYRSNLISVNNEEKSQTSLGKRSSSTNSKKRGRNVLYYILGPVLITSLIGTALYDIPEQSVTLPRIGPYGITPGESKLRVVVEKVSSENFKSAQKEKTSKKKDAISKNGASTSRSSWSNRKKNENASDDNNAKDTKRKRNKRAASETASSSPPPTSQSFTSPSQDKYEPENSPASTLVPPKVPMERAKEDKVTVAEKADRVEKKDD